jgi:hypothetical protein
MFVILAIARIEPIIVSQYAKAHATLGSIVKRETP